MMSSRSARARTTVLAAHGTPPDGNSLHPPPSGPWAANPPPPLHSKRKTKTQHALGASISFTLREACRALGARSAKRYGSAPALHSDGATAPHRTGKRLRKLEPRIAPGAVRNSSRDSPILQIRNTPTARPPGHRHRPFGGTAIDNAFLTLRKC